MMVAPLNNQGMELGFLLKGLVDPVVLEKYGHINIEGMSLDSRTIAAGDMFIALPGHSAHGLSFALSAIDQGACMVLWDGDTNNAGVYIQEIPDNVLCLQCENLKKNISEIAARFYARPSAELNMVGVTGTDGKTSISHFVAQCLDSANGRCGLLGTLGAGFVGELKLTGLTTADPINIQQTLASIRDTGSLHAVMEVSSHGLDQGRVSAVEFDIAVFSNLSQDHLDYHGSMEAYFSAKKTLFQMRSLKAAVINLDDDYGKKLALEMKSRVSVWGYSTQTDVSALKQYSNFIVHPEQITADNNGFSLAVSTPKGSANLDINLLGEFNVSNLMAALAVVLISGIDFETAIRKLSTLTAVPGRMQIITANEKPTVIIDYAHTPHGLESACAAVHSHYSGELWCVFGCGGDRDRGKRAKMAVAAESKADHVVVTSDNPRHEDPKQIIGQIVSGFSNTKNITQIVDRAEAIKYAVQHAKPGDVILIAGKGHENTQQIGDAYKSFDDSRVARDYLGIG